MTPRLGRRLPGHAPAPSAPTAEAIELVAAGIGLLVVPQSLARLHHRKDLAYRPVTDAPRSSVALTWPEADTTELMEEFIGIVRGRTVNSSRTPAVGCRPARPPLRGDYPATSGPSSVTPAPRRPNAVRTLRSGHVRR